MYILNALYVASDNCFIQMWMLKKWRQFNSIICIQYILNGPKQNKC